MVSFHQLVYICCCSLLLFPLYFLFDVIIVVVHKEPNKKKKWQEILNILRFIFFISSLKPARQIVVLPGVEYFHCISCVFSKASGNHWIVKATHILFNVAFYYCCHFNIVVLMLAHLQVPVKGFRICGTKGKECIWKMLCETSLL